MRGKELHAERRLKMEGLEVRDVEKKEVKKGEAESLKIKVGREEERKNGKGNAEAPRTDDRRFRANRLFRKAEGGEPAWPGAADEDGEIADKGAPFSAHGEEEKSVTLKVLFVNVYLMCNSNDCETY